MIVLIVSLIFVQTGIAQPALIAAESTTDSPPSTAAISVPTMEQLQAKIKALEEDTQLSAVERDKVLTLYQLALTRLQDAQNYATDAARFQQAIVSAPQETEIMRQSLEKKITQEPVELLLGADLETLETQLGIEQTRLGDLRDQWNALNQQIASQQARPQSLRTELADAKQKLAELEKEGQAAVVGDATTLLAEANRLVFLAKRSARTHQIEKLEQELLSYDARLALLNAQRDVTKQQLDAAEEHFKQVQEQANQRRLNEAIQTSAQAEQASQQVADKPILIREAAVENTALSQQLEELAIKISEISREQEILNESLKSLTARYQNIQQQLAIAGLSNVLGPVLRSERRQLPNLQQYQRGVKERTKQIASARLKQFHIDDQRRALGDLEETVKRLLAESSEPQLSESQRQVVELELPQLLTDRQQVLAKLSNGYASYISKLVQLDQDQKQLVDKAHQYATLLDEKLIWIASGKPVNLAWLIELQTSVSWLIAPMRWVELSEQLWRGLVAAPVRVSLALGLLLFLALKRRVLRLRLVSLGEQVGNVSKDSFIPTLKALGITLLLAIPWPLLIGLVGWLLETPSDNTHFSKAVGVGLYHVAALFLVITLFLQLCRNQGLAHLHFRWGERTRMVLKRNLQWLLWMELVPTFVVGFTEWHSEAVYRDTLGRLAFIIGSIMLAIFLWRVLRPRNGALTEFLSNHQDGWWWRLRYLWYPLLVATPLLLAGLALWGYYYTALKLESQVFTSGWLLVAVVIIGNLVVRVISINERRLALARARFKRDTMLAARASRDATEATSASVPESPNIPEVDLETLSTQTRGLLYLFAVLGSGVGLWLIWDDLLPAFTRLNEVTLWQYASVIEGQEVLQFITLGSLVLAMAIVILTWVVVRNLPGVLEIGVFHWFSMETGNRYAITTISRYLITTVGVVSALNTMGISWGKAQWLVAALGVGLGFGLQEIFANFVSGLILLFERPIRIGDTVTVGNLSGTVSRIRIRATTITDWDRKELVIPNKMFITGQLTNWTLTDPITRLILQIGIAYGSNIELAQKVMLEVAETNPLVLKDPAPSVFFLSFGPSSLDFEIRVFVRELADRIPLTHELNLGIDKALREHNIQIPFPQQDVHIVSGLPKS